MSRIASQFRSLKDAGRRALIPFVTAGDPNLEITVPLMHTLVEAGADIIELGVPFSDPMADGPVIQRASERALEHHVSLHDVMGLVREFRQQNSTTPVVLMGYLNPIEVMGYQAFAEQASAAGVDGVLTVDIPPEEAGDFVSVLRAKGLDTIFLLAPTSGRERIKMITSIAAGFVYYVSLKGVTGAASLDLDTVRDKIAEIRQATDLPVGVGFGIKDKEMAASMAAIADAIVVGSALVSKIEENRNDQGRILDQIRELIAGMRQAIDAAT